MLSKIIENTIKRFIIEYDTNFDLTDDNGKKLKSGGHKDFKKIAQKGISVNRMTNPDGSDFDFGSLLRNVPGARYPRTEKQIGGNNQAELNDEADEMEKEIRNSLKLGNKKYKDEFIFAYGVHRMLFDGEVVSDKDKKVLSDICIYLSENPSALNPQLSQDTMFKDRNWSSGIANFYGMSFNTLKANFGKEAKKYVAEKFQVSTIESDLVTSNGYYLYPCYTYATANYVGSTFKQGMCFFNSPTFWQQHTGDSGALFMFKRVEDYNGGRNDNNGLYPDNKSYNEIVISTHIDENGEVYIDGITNGNNITYYNKEHHPGNNLSQKATDFSENEIQLTSQILGTINGEEVFHYCIDRTKKRQDSKYDDIFKNSNYEMYVNMSNRNPEYKTEDADFGLTLFPFDGKVYCIDNNRQRIFLIEPKGFITCNGREVQNTDTPFYQRISYYMPKYYKDWVGFKHNKRNKYPYNESKIRKIIHETIDYYILKNIYN
jgi:hypothetical protein